MDTSHITVHHAFIDDLITVHKFKPPAKWRQSFENYLKTMPPYYITVSNGINRVHFNITKVIKLSYFLYFFILILPGPAESTKNDGSSKPVG